MDDRADTQFVTQTFQLLGIFASISLLLATSSKIFAQESVGAPTETKAQEAESGPRVYGWKEWVQIGAKAEVMRAKLDSGARTSSLHAENERYFERDGRQWVEFVLCNPNDKESKRIVITAPVQRIARVKNTDGTMERRRVVELNFSVGAEKFREAFTLNDRTGMTCPVLLGRNALAEMGLVDCSRVDLAKKKARLEPQP